MDRPVASAGTIHRGAENGKPVSMRVLYSGRVRKVCEIISCME